jgi:four helix bundle protein
MEAFSKEKFLKRLYEYALEIIHFTDSLQKDMSSRVIANQLVRSGTSVTANVMEAQAASSRKDYINFYTHALKSANESKLWISLLRDSKKCGVEQAEKLINETGELSKILAASIITLKKNRE